ncbi:MAG: selenium cofactor biosynthesis protein YqeC [Alphaproteobacteria bacterium]
MSGQLLDVLNARHGIVCAVGAGGKKTTLYRLAAMHPGRIGITATVVTLRAPQQSCDVEILAQGEELVTRVLAATKRHRRIAFARSIDKPERRGGLDEALIRRIHREAGFDATLVKADGARMRLIKAPGGAEPVIPAGATTVIPVVSARVVGLPFTDKIAHRPERLAAVTGAVPGEILAPVHLARLLASPDGALRRVGDAVVVPVINMVDGPDDLAHAVEAARLALALSARFDRVALTRMIAAEPLVQIVTRDG